MCRRLGRRRYLHTVEVGGSNPSAPTGDREISGTVTHHLTHHSLVGHVQPAFRFLEDLDASPTTLAMPRVTSSV
jgi:hypothetical protein